MINNRDEPSIEDIYRRSVFPSMVYSMVSSMVNDENQPPVIDEPLFPVIDEPQPPVIDEPLSPFNDEPQPPVIGEPQPPVYILDDDNIDFSNKNVHCSTDVVVYTPELEKVRTTFLENFYVNSM